jgi:hypothetical protein
MSELKRLLNVFKLQIVQEIEQDNSQLQNRQDLWHSNRSTVVKWLKKNSVTLIGKTKHHLLCQSRQNKR